MILFVVVYVSVLAFSASGDVGTFQAAWAAQGQSGMTWTEWSKITPAWEMAFPAGYEQYNAIGFLLIFWVLRMLLEGFGGPLIPYASQRFFAARDDREASLTTGSSLAMFVIRWPLIVGVAVLGLGLGSAIPADPEHIFPAVLGHYFPEGLRAVVVSCMIAAAMSTFDSTVNAGGAYIVNDIYRRFIKPNASTRALMTLSWMSTIVLTVLAVALAANLESINEIWGWLSMGLFGGMAIPFILRWYWERFNGWGYAVGTLVGMSAAIVQKACWPALSEAYQLLLIGVMSLLASLAATWLTAPTDAETLQRFYRRTRPMGRWSRARTAMAEEEKLSIGREHRRDMVSVLLALVFFFCLFLAPMYAVIRDWGPMTISLIAVSICGIGLYFSWYRPLGADPAGE
jgi:Na+/proline symporter